MVIFELRLICARFYGSKEDHGLNVSPKEQA